MFNYVISLLIFIMLIFTPLAYSQSPSFLGTNSPSSKTKGPTPEDYTKAVTKAQQQQFQDQVNSKEIPSPNSAIMAGAPSRSNAPSTTTEKKPEKSIYQNPQQEQAQVQQQVEQPQSITPLNQTLPFATGTAAPTTNALPPPGTPPSPPPTQPGSSGYYSGFSGGTSGGAGTGTKGGTTGGASGGWGGGIYH